MDDLVPSAPKHESTPDLLGDEQYISANVDEEKLAQIVTEYIWDLWLSEIRLNQERGGRSNE